MEAVKQIRGLLKRVYFRFVNPQAEVSKWRKSGLLADDGAKKLKE